MAKPSSDDTAPSDFGAGATQWRRANDLLDEQERQWLKGHAVPVEDFLAAQPTLFDRPHDLIDLIFNEITLREDRGEAPELAEYLARFPRLSDQLRLQFAIHRGLGSDDSRGANTLRMGSAGAETPPPLVPGFEDIERIGAGGMGVVYRATQVGLNRTVALKMLRGGAAGPEARARFKTEVEAVARLRHPGVVQVFEIGETEGRPYCALEYVAGGGLDQRLLSGPMPPAAAARMIERLSRAAHAAHQAGVLHRDLKPANVLIQAEEGAPHDVWEPKISDFGLAKLVDSGSRQTHTGEILGTPSYMAPEQVGGAGRQVGPAADLYAIGAIFYECLTGRPPFRAASSLETLHQVLTEDPVSPSRLQPRTPRDLVTICLKCLEKVPAKRYATAAALADDLGRFLAGKPILARPVGLLERIGRWGRRNPTPAAACALALASLLGVTSLSIRHSISADQNAEDHRLSAAVLRSALQTSEENRKKAVFRLAENYLERGRSLSEQGSGAAAMLFLARGLELAHKDAMPLQKAFRTQLGVLANDLHRPTLVLDSTGQINSVAISVDGNRLAAGMVGGMIVVWDTRTGNRFGELHGHRSNLRILAFSADGRRLLSGSNGEPARLWDLATSRQIGEPLAHGGGVQTVSFSPDGQKALTGSNDGTARIWDANTGKPIGAPLRHQGEILIACFDPKGEVVLAGGGDHMVHLWDAATGLPRGTILQHDQKVKTAAFAPDGQSILTGSDDGTARLWDRATGKLLGPPVRHPYEVRAVAFSSDGRFFVTGSLDGSAQVWDTATRQAVGKPLEHHGGVNSVAFSADGAAVLTSSDDRTACLWDARTGGLFGLPLQHEGEVWGAAFCPDGRLLTWGIDDPVRLWRIAPGTPIKLSLRVRQWVSAVDFSADGTTILTASGDPVTRTGRIQFWDAATGAQKRKSLEQPGPVLAAAFSPDARLVVAGLGNPFLGPGEARLWDVASGQPAGRALPHEKAVAAVAFSPDGTHFLTASRDHHIRLWETSSATLVQTMAHPEGVLAAAFSPDGLSILSGSEDRTARLWEVATGKPVGEPLKHQDMVMAVAFNRDGRTAMTGSSDGTARLWDLAKGRPIGNPLRHRSWIRAVGFSPDGHTALTASADKTVQLWDAITGKPIARALRYQDWVVAAAFSRDGQTVLAGGKDGTARLWSVQTPVDGDVERIVLAAQVATGAELDVSDVVHVLDPRSWRRRSQRLDELGGPPWLMEQSSRSPDSLPKNSRQMPPVISPSEP